MWTAKELQKQLESHRFQVYFVPQYDIFDMQMSEVGIYIKYKNEENVLDDASSFLPILEKYNIAAILDLWVWNKICKLQQEIIKRRGKIYPIYVKVSLGTICNPYNIYDMILARESLQVPESAVHIALTVAKPCHSIPGLGQGITYLRKKGMKIMLDTFGNTLTTQGFLVDAYFDQVQIDRKFLKEAMKSARHHTVLNHVIKRSKEINVPVVLNGIDTLSEYQYALAIGGCYAGGDFFEKKLTEDGFIKKVTANENEY